MTAARPRVPSPQQLAQLLIAHVTDNAVISLERLRRDPFVELANDETVTVQLIEPDRLPAGCSIAATYTGATVPARISVSNDLSAGRRAFSCLHEYAHHLRDQVDAVIVALYDLPDGGAALEELVCDAFAAAVLIPQVEVDEAFRDGVTAARVADLIRGSTASREAVAVAAAASLPSPGYVMLLDAAATAVFTARRHDALPVARDTRQRANELVAAARVGRGRGVSSVSFATGNTTSGLHYDAAPCRGMTVVVLVSDSPAWTGFTVQPFSRSEGQQGYCESCAQEYTTYEPSCAACGEPKCPRCGECSCIPELIRASGERRCEGCGDLCGPARFASATAVRCRDCA